MAENPVGDLVLHVTIGIASQAGGSFPRHAAKQHHGRSVNAMEQAKFLVKQIAD